MSRCAHRRFAMPPDARRPSLGLAACTAIVVGNMVGSGFYLSPAAVAPYGLLAIVFWIVMGIGALCLGLTFARLARRLPATGGPYAYTRAAYGSRRGNDKVMMRGTFANVRIKNLMVPGVEGGVTRHQPDGEQMAIYDASIRYQAAGTPLIIFAGQEYGTGSSRDWAAKGTRLLGVKAVIAQSFERIHRSNLVGMGVLPCQFKEGTSAATLGLDGTETFDLIGLEKDVRPLKELTLVIKRASGK